MVARLTILPNALFVRLMLILSVIVVVFIAVAAFVFRDDIYQSLLDPGIPYQTYDRPAAPDYSEQSSWAYWPSNNDPTIPAVFFVHPTTYDGGAHWNAPIDREQEIEEINSIVLPNWAAPFADEDRRLFAPHYRQASLYTFMNNREDSVRARQTAFYDIEQAFAVFLENLDRDTPYILVGVGQGSLHALRLLTDDIAGSDRNAKRLAAAYLLEAPTPIDLFVDGPLTDLPICEDETKIRCVIAFTSLLPEETHRLSIISERSMSWTVDGDLDYVTGRGLVCVNPLLWTTSEDYAPERLHRGGAAAENLSLEDRPSPMANQTGAQCQNGLLFTERPRTQALRRQMRLGEVRRVPQFNLFYMDLRDDAERRTDRARRVLAEEAKWAPPLSDAVEVRKSVVQPIDN